MALGDFLTPHLLTDRVPLEEMETTLEGKWREAFFMFHAKEVVEDEWIHSHM